MADLPLPSGAGPSRWHQGAKKFRRTRMVPIHVDWLCPICTLGLMVDTGHTWPQTPTRQKARHHQCDSCGVVLAAHESFPLLEYRPEEEKESD